MDEYRDIISLNGWFPTIFYMHPKELKTRWIDNIKANKTGTVLVRYNEAHSWIHYCSGKGTGITCSECVYVALGIQNAERMRRVILISVVCPALPDFSTGTFVNPLLQWKRNRYYMLWVCVCSLRYPECRAHAQCYIDICGLSGFTRFLYRHIRESTIAVEKEHVLHALSVCM